tara:strand:- start:250 stop:843 length:594 start_codon:yes stop_codon:yes gene_type:complete
MNWTPQNIDTLETMWLWGHSSRTISEVLEFPTRNAVMGKINRLGLMKRGGEYVGAQLQGAQLDISIIQQELEGLTQSDFSWNDPTDRALMVQMGALLVGHHAETVSAAIGKPLPEVAQTMEAMHRTGVWRKGEKPPSKWWENKEGNVAFLLDAMVTAGIIVFEDREGERYYATPKEGGRAEAATKKISQHAEGMAFA